MYLAQNIYRNEQLKKCLQLSVINLAFKYKQKFCKLFLHTLYLIMKHTYLRIYFPLVLIRVTIILKIVLKF